MPTADLGVSAYIVAVAVGFAAAGRAGRVVDVSGRDIAAMAPVSAAAISDRKSFAIRWWEAFRLVLLLAIGPALVALALATAPMAFRVATKVKPLPGGGSVQIQTNSAGRYLRDHDRCLRAPGRIRQATDAEIAEAGPAPPTQTRGGLLGIAALAIVTVLVHGAAFVSLGAALGIWIRRRSRAIAASVGLVLFVTVGWPIISSSSAIRDDSAGAWSWRACCRPSGALLFELNHPELIANTIVEWVVYWDVILILSAVVVAGLAIRTVGRRSRGDPPAGTDDEEPVAVEGPTRFNTIRT